MYLIVDTSILITLLKGGNYTSRTFVFPMFKVNSRKYINSLKNVKELSHFTFQDYKEDFWKTDEFKLSNYPEVIKYYRKYEVGGNTYIFLNGFYSKGKLGLIQELCNIPDSTELFSPFSVKYFKSLIELGKL